MKAKFKVLRTPGEHHINRQVQLVYTLAVLWNFMRRHQQLDDDEVLEDDNKEESASTAAAAVGTAPQRRTKWDNKAMKGKRLSLAAKLWAQYQVYLAGRN
ncbi:hypothetical protein Pst134EB_014810 [Puccinia striiformis f. sp. tritici]|nr:hypothetical protein Pst134EB_014810 [Puccinia striiformis f. sp. tritici]